MDGWMGPCSSWWVTMTTEASRVFGLLPTNAPALVSGSPCPFQVSPCQISLGGIPPNPRAPAAETKTYNRYRNIFC